MPTAKTREDFLDMAKESSTAEVADALLDNHNQFHLTMSDWGLNYLWCFFCKKETDA